MNAVEVWTIFAPYYRHLSESGCRKFFAHGYRLSLERVLQQDFIRIIDESTGLVTLEAGIGPGTHLASPRQANLYRKLLNDRHKWMQDHGIADLLRKRLRSDKYPPGDPTEMITKRRVLIQRPISKKSRKMDRYVCL